jgi:phage N-6-adenine-methyltransferase
VEMNKFKGLMTSLTCEWATPQWLFDELNKEFKFELDVCATSDNHKCEQYYVKEQNSLNLPWAKVNWMNPPYGREIYRWVERAYTEKFKGNATVCLLPARTDTKWWHSFVLGGGKRDPLY